MSTNPEDRLVTLLSHWLARHVSDDELLGALESADVSELDEAQAEAVAELADELRAGSGRGALEMVARETLEALALGG